MTTELIMIKPIAINFFFTKSPTTVIYTLSLHDALPISHGPDRIGRASTRRVGVIDGCSPPDSPPDRKSTRLNSSHVESSYAVFCLKKKKKKKAIHKAQTNNQDATLQTIDTLISQHRRLK